MLYNNATDALILDLGTNTSFSIPSLITPPANLSPNTSYTVYVIGSNSLGPSPKSATITFTTPPAPPTITVSGTSLTIPTSTGATNYRLISLPPIVPAPTITPGTTSFSSLGLVAGTAYTLSLATTGANGIESLPGATTTVYTPPNPIVSVTYGASTSSTAAVSWSAPSVGGVTGYNIYDGSTLYARVIARTVTFGSTGGNPPLASGTTFTNFSIKAYFNTFGNESTSVPLSFSTTAIINPPTNVLLTGQTDTTASLSWTPPATGNKDGFYITTTTPSGSSSVYTVPGNATVTTYTITGLNPGTIYVFNIFTYFGTTSQRSSAVVVPTAFTIPLPPTGFTATPAFGGATLTWSAQTLPINADIIGYKIYDVPSGTIPAYTVAKTSPLSQVVTGLASNSSYTYYIATYGTRNSTPVESTTRASVTFTTLSLNQPTNGVASSITSNSTILTWTPVNNGETGYNIYDGTNLYVTLPGIISTIILGDLSSGYVQLIPGTAYSFNVRAYFGTTTTESPALNITFSTYNNHPRPSNVSIDFGFITETSAKVRWTPVSGPYDGYFIYLYYNQDYTTPAAYFRAPGVSTNEFSPTGLLPGSIFSFGIRTYTGNPSLDNSPSNIPLLGFDIRYSDTLGLTFPTAPINPVVSNITGTSATISWSPGPTPSGGNTRVYRYNIYNGTTFVQFVNVGVTTYNITSLVSNTSYTFNIKSVAEGRPGGGISDRESQTGATVTFTTAPNFIEPPGGSPQSFNRYWKSITCDSTGQYVYAFDLGHLGDTIPVFYFSVDYGYTWTTDTVLRDKQSGSGRIINNVSMSGSGSRVLCSSTHEAYTYTCNNLSATSSGGTLDWQFPGGPLSYGQHNTTDSTPTACGVMSKDGTTAYVCGNTGVNSRVYTTVYNGSGWPDIATVGTKTYTNWAAVACSSNGEYVYAVPGSATTGKVQRFRVGVSTDWDESSYNNADTSYTAIVCSNSGQYVYATISSVGVVYSTDYGVTWSLLGAETNPITTIVCSADGTKVFSIENTNGIFKRWIRSGSTYTYTSALPTVGVNPGYDNYMACNDDGTKVLIASKRGGITIVA